MPQLKIAVDLAATRLPVKKALHTAAELGAQAVEIDARSEITPQLPRTGVRQLRKMLDDLRLRVSAIRFRTRRGYGTLADLDARVAATKAAMTLAYDLGASLVTNHVGMIPSDADSPGWRTLVEVLSDLGAHGQRVGAQLAAETGTAGPEPLARLLASLPGGSLAINFDPGGLVQNGYSPVDAVGPLGPFIRLVRACDAHRGAAGYPGEPAAMGRGDVDFPAVLAELEQRDYRGYFTVGDETSGEPREAIARAIRHLNML